MKTLQVRLSRFYTSEGFWVLKSFPQLLQTSVKVLKNKPEIQISHRNLLSRLIIYQRLDVQTAAVGAADGPGASLCWVMSWAQVCLSVMMIYRFVFQDRRRSAAAAGGKSRVCEITLNSSYWTQNTPKYKAAFVINKLQCVSLTVSVNKRELESSRFEVNLSSL